MCPLTQATGRSVLDHRPHMESAPESSQGLAQVQSPARVSWTLILKHVQQHRMLSVTRASSGFPNPGTAHIRPGNPFLWRAGLHIILCLATFLTLSIRSTTPGIESVPGGTTLSALVNSVMEVSPDFLTRARGCGQRATCNVPVYLWPLCGASKDPARLSGTTPLPAPILRTSGSAGLPRPPGPWGGHADDAAVGGHPAANRGSPPHYRYF